MVKKKISDAELLGRDLIVTDAYDHDGLVREKLPGGVTVREPLACYIHERYEQGEKVFCCVCGVAKHKLGYWAGCSDETVRTLGNCCAKPHLGRDWLRGEQAFKDLKNRKGYLLKLQAMCPAALRARSRLASWEKLGSELKDRQRAFFKAMPDVYELIVQSAKRDGVLEATERVQNILWDPKKPGDEPKWRHLPRNHLIAGRAFLRFTDTHETKAVVDRAILNFARVAGDTDAHSTKQLQKACADLEAAKRLLDRLVEMADAYSAFFSDENLDGIVRWSQLLSGEHDGRLRRPIGRVAGGLLYPDTDAAFTLQALSQPDTEVVRLLAA